jgi:hypothetical protein
MPDDRSEDRAYERARKRVEDLRGFYIHLAVYLVVNLGLFIINRMTSPGTNWFLWPLLGWGVALVLHGLSLLFEGPWNQRWVERKTQQLMEKERSRWRPGPPQPRAP